MRISRRSRRLVAATLTLALVAPSPAFAVVPNVVKNAACNANSGTPQSAGQAAEQAVQQAGGGEAAPKVDCKTQGGVAGFVNAADALISPAIIVMAAITPIACLVGAGAVMFGNRRGLPIIGSALGALVFVISIKGIVQ